VKLSATSISARVPEGENIGFLRLVQTAFCVYGVFGNTVCTVKPCVASGGFNGAIMI